MVLCIFDAVVLLNTISQARIDESMMQLIFGSGWGYDATTASLTLILFKMSCGMNFPTREGKGGA